MIPEVSIVIVNWNTEHLLRNCLNSVFAMMTLNFEVIVIDNGSTDKSVYMCRHLFPQVKLIQNKMNLGFSKACNQGIQLSRANYVLLLNSDTIMTPLSVEIMVRLMRKDPSIGVVGCRLIKTDGSYQPSCMNFPTIIRVLIERLLLYKLLSKFPRQAKEPPYIFKAVECDWVVGACMLIRKKALKTAGIFDTSILMYGEEMELCYRIKSAKWKILFEPRVSIFHVESGSWNEKRYSPTFLKMNGMLLFFKKHYPYSSYIIVCLLTLIGAILRSLIWPILYLLKSEKRATILLEIKSNLRILGKILRISKML